MRICSAPWKSRIFQLPSPEVPPEGFKPEQLLSQVPSQVPGLLPSPRVPCVGLSEIPITWQGQSPARPPSLPASPRALPVPARSPLSRPGALSSRPLRWRLPLSCEGWDGGNPLPCLLPLPCPAACGAGHGLASIN